MKKWLVILIMALLLTGCGKQQEGSSEQIQKESVEEESKEQSQESKQTEE